MITPQQCGARVSLEVDEVEDVGIAKSKVEKWRHAKQRERAARAWLYRVTVSKQSKGTNDRTAATSTPSHLSLFHDCTYATASSDVRREGTAGRYLSDSGIIASMHE